MCIESPSLNSIFNIKNFEDRKIECYTDLKKAKMSCSETALVVAANVGVVESLKFQTMRISLIQHRKDDRFLFCSSYEIIQHDEQ